MSVDKGLACGSLDKVHRNNARIATGTYDGDNAATQDITGVGFTPRFVLIWRQSDVGVTSGYGLKTDIDGLNAFLINLGVPNFRYRADMIISFDADGFTVGDGTGLGNMFNVLANSYGYLCLG